ncbi:unnamed protein product [Amoebophrya sp. A25]|nr:unnamed protein product [Amoebophrya sp. A25]|eukprot:GSA25T00018366001.1
MLLFLFRTSFTSRDSDSSKPFSFASEDQEDPHADDQHHKSWHDYRNSQPTPSSSSTASNWRRLGVKQQQTGNMGDNKLEQSSTKEYDHPVLLMRSPLMRCASSSTSVVGGSEGHHSTSTTSEDSTSTASTTIASTVAAILHSGSAFDPGSSYSVDFVLEADALLEQDHEDVTSRKLQVLEVSDTGVVQCNVRPIEGRLYRTLRPCMLSPALRLTTTEGRWTRLEQGVVLRALSGEVDISKETQRGAGDSCQERLSRVRVQTGNGNVGYVTVRELYSNTVGKSASGEDVRHNLAVLNEMEKSLQKRYDEKRAALKKLREGSMSKHSAEKTAEPLRAWLAHQPRPIEASIEETAGNYLLWRGLYGDAIWKEDESSWREEHHQASAVVGELVWLDEGDPACVLSLDGHEEASADGEAGPVAEVVLLAKRSEERIVNWDGDCGSTTTIDESVALNTTGDNYVEEAASSTANTACMGTITTGTSTLTATSASPSTTSSGKNVVMKVPLYRLLSNNAPTLASRKRGGGRGETRYQTYRGYGGTTSEDYTREQQHGQVVISSRVGIPWNEPSVGTLSTLLSAQLRTAYSDVANLVNVVLDMYDPLPLKAMLEELKRYRRHALLAQKQQQEAASWRGSSRARQQEDDTEPFWEEIIESITNDCLQSALLDETAAVPEQNTIGDDKDDKRRKLSSQDDQDFVFPSSSRTPKHVVPGQASSSRSPSSSSTSSTSSSSRKRRKRNHVVEESTSSSELSPHQLHSGVDSEPPHKLGTDSLLCRVIVKARRVQTLQDRFRRVGLKLDNFSELVARRSANIQHLRSLAPLVAEATKAGAIEQTTSTEQDSCRWTVEEAEAEAVVPLTRVVTDTIQNLVPQFSHLVARYNAARADLFHYSVLFHALADREWLSGVCRGERLEAKRVAALEMRTAFLLPFQRWLRHSESEHEQHDELVKDSSSASSPSRTRKTSTTGEKEAQLRQQFEADDATSSGVEAFIKRYHSDHRTEFVFEAILRRQQQKLEDFGLFCKRCYPRAQAAAMELYQHELFLGKNKDIYFAGTGLSSSSPTSSNTTRQNRRERSRTRGGPSEDVEEVTSTTCTRTACRTAPGDHRMTPKGDPEEHDHYETRLRDTTRTVIVSTRGDAKLRRQMLALPAWIAAIEALRSNLFQTNGPVQQRFERERRRSEVALFFQMQKSYRHRVEETLSTRKPDQESRREEWIAKISCCGMISRQGFEEFEFSPAFILAVFKILWTTPENLESKQILKGLLAPPEHSSAHEERRIGPAADAGDMKRREDDPLLNEQHEEKDAPSTVEEGEERSKVPIVVPSPSLETEMAKISCSALEILGRSLAFTTKPVTCEVSSATVLPGSIVEIRDGTSIEGDVSDTIVLTEYKANSSTSATQLQGGKSATTSGSSLEVGVSGSTSTTDTTKHDVVEYVVRRNYLEDVSKSSRIPPDSDSVQQLTTRNSAESEEDGKTSALVHVLPSYYLTIDTTLSLKKADSANNAIGLHCGDRVELCAPPVSMKSSNGGPKTCYVVRARVRLCTPGRNQGVTGWITLFKDGRLFVR